MPWSVRSARSGRAPRRRGAPGRVPGDMKMARAGVPYIIAALLASAGLLFCWHRWGGRGWAGAAIVAAVLALSFLWFFRDPERRVRRDPGILLAPADGIVHRFHEGRDTVTLEIFLRIWDVHIQRAPAAGKVVSVRYTKGGYLPANMAGAGTRNTRCLMMFSTKRGRMGVTQVAGLVARKVESWMKPGQEILQGERIGIIHMGSQCRLELPKGAVWLVKKGQKIYGGLTPVARWGRRRVS